MKIINTILASFIALCLTGSAFAKSHKTFDEKQKTAIESIVREYLLKNPEILVDVSKELEKRQREMMMEKAQSAIQENKEALFNAKSPVLGNKKGTATIVEFFDFQCGHCKRMTEVISGLVSDDGQLRVIYKQLPIFGGVSEYAAKAALAAAKQDKYEQLHKALMAYPGRLSKKQIDELAKSAGVNVKKMKEDMKSPEVDKELKANMKLARELRIMGTPAFIVSGNLDKKNARSFYIPGATSGEKLKAMVKDVRS